MHEMDVQRSETLNVDGRTELGHLVQARLLFAPVIAFAPELDCLADLADGYAIVLAPLLVRNVGGQTREFQLTAQKVKLGVGDTDLLFIRL